MNSEWLYCFLETSRQKSFSKASAALNLTQPALSKQIRHLEDELGVKVFRRSTSGVELTKEGELFQGRLIPLLNEFETLKKDVLNLSQLSAVRLATLPSMAAHFLPQKLTYMNRQGIQIDMHVFSTSTEIMSKLQSGQMDLAIIQTSESLPKNCWSHTLVHESFYAVIPDSHPLVEKDAVTLYDLADEELIMYPDQCDVRKCVVEAYHALRLEPKITVEVAFGESIPGFIASGAGLSILPETIAKHAQPSSLHAIPILDSQLNRTLSLFTLNPDLGKKIYRYFKD